MLPLVFIERGQFVPETGLAAADARMSRAHGPVGPVEFDLRAVVHSVRALAAQLIQTPAVAGLFGIEGGSEFAVVEVFPALALVVHAVAVEHHGAVVGVELDVVAAEEGDQRAHEIQRVRGAAADVDGLDALRAEAFVDAHRAGGVGLGRLHAAERGTGAVGDHGLGLGDKRGFSYCRRGRFGNDILAQEYVLWGSS